MIDQMKRFLKKGQRGAVVAEFVPIPAMIGGIVLAIILIANS
jgi:hypothetical protein